MRTATGLGYRETPRSGFLIVPCHYGQGYVIFDNIAEYPLNILKH